MLLVELPDVTLSAYEGRTSSLGRAPWAHLKSLRVKGTSRLVEVKAGLFWEENYDLGTYYSADGTTYLCNRHAAWEMSYNEMVDFEPVSAGRHTGGVFSVNYKFDPASSMRSREI